MPDKPRQPRYEGQPVMPEPDPYEQANKAVASMVLGFLEGMTKYENAGRLLGGAALLATGNPAGLFDVAEWHTYFVATTHSCRPSAALWVHNKGRKLCDKIDDIVGAGPESRAMRRGGVSRTPRHHIFPQEHKTWFENRGFNIDRYTLPLDQGTHSAIHSLKWNDVIMSRLQAKEALKQQVFGSKARLNRREMLKVGAEVRREYGLSHVKAIRFDD